MTLGRLHPSDEYDIRIAVEEGEGGSLNGKWIAMLVDEIEHYSTENARLTAENEAAWQTLARERDSWQAEADGLTARIAALEAERDAATARAERAELDRRAVRAALQDYYSAAWMLTGKPTITADGTQAGWNDLRNLAEQPIMRLIARHRAALAGSQEGRDDE